MTATLTDPLKRQILDRVLYSIGSDSDTYYIAIGRSEQWNDSDVATAPENHEHDERNFRLSMQSVKSAEDASYVVPRNNWTAGSVYSAYDDKVIGHPTQPYFVITDEQNVYLCIQRGLNTDGTTKQSSVKPTGTSTSLLSTGDGYVWKYMYSVPTASAQKFLSSNYMPVQQVDSDLAVANPTTDGLQWAVQNAAVGGQITQIKVVNGGSGYTSAPTVTIDGDGSSAAATAFVSGGQVTKLEMSNRGSGYQFASISFTGGGGSGASARAVIAANKQGIGDNPIIDFRAKAVMLNSKPDGLENGDFILNDYRQIAILKNPTTYANDSDFYTGTSGLALKTIRLTLTGDASTFANDDIITGGTSGSSAVLDWVDSDTLYYHQTDTTGYGSFISDITGAITSDNGGAGTVRSVIDSSDVNPFSGEILYLENRAAITRSLVQTEDLKVIIQL